MSERMAVYTWGFCVGGYSRGSGVKWISWTFEVIVKILNSS